MNRETIIKLAREAGLIDFRDALSSHYVQAVLDDLEHFAKLVAEHEREACATLADVEADEWGSNSDGCYASRNIAAAIRARGNT
jgi:hypothetical protein